MFDGLFRVADLCAEALQIPLLADLLDRSEHRSRVFLYVNIETVDSIILVEDLEGFLLAKLAFLCAICYYFEFCDTALLSVSFNFEEFEEIGRLDLECTFLAFL